MYYTRRMVDGQTTAGTPAGDVGHDHGAADVLVKELAGDEAIKAADTLLLAIRNQLRVDYNATCSKASSSTSLRNLAGAVRER